MSARKVVCVVGSTKFRDEIKEWALERTLDQHELILFAPFAKEEIPNLEHFRRELEIQHCQKIRMSDCVFVFNKDKYIGDSTKLEIQYAKSINKSIEYLESEE